MQVLQHVGVGGSVVEDHQDTEGEALRRAVLLQLVHQLYLAVHLKNVARHPSPGIGVPMDIQAGFFIALKCMRVLGVVRHDGLEFVTL